jgi:hypothetical protein
MIPDLVGSEHFSGIDPLTGRWQEMMGAAHAAMGSDRRRDWQWHAPDMVEELNAGVEVKPLEPQLASSDQIEAIAA